MTSKLTRERIELIANFHRAMTLPPSHAEIEELARMALAAMDSEPVAYISKSDFNAGYPHILARRDFNKACTMAVYAAQPAPVVPENCVTAEHRRVIEMLLNVCGAAFELADDSCQQDVDGEDCHVVPDDAFQKLSDALDEIENTLPTEDIDRPDVFLAWSAMPRAALKSLLQAQPAPVVDADDNFYSWFGREWAENYQHNQYTTAAKQMLGVMAESAWKAATERQRQKQNVSVPDVKMYEDVPYEVGRLKTHRDCYCDGWNACRAAMLQELKKVQELKRSAGVTKMCRYCTPNLRRNPIAARRKTTFLRSKTATLQRKARDGFR